jgi:integrase
MSRNGNGVEIRDKSIRIGFTLNGGFVRETLKIDPTPGNVKYAANLVVRINQRIGDGTFDYAEFFPDSPRAGKARGAHTFGEMCDLWFDTKGRLATKTKRQYRNALGVWKEIFGAQTPIDKLTHAIVASKVGKHAWSSAKLLNNYLICLRGVFKLAGRDLKIDNPTDGIENSKHQAPPPDPLSIVEMEAIMKWLGDTVDDRVWAYYEFAFMTGMRPEEIIALKWTDYDPLNATIRVERARSDGEIKPLKTYNARDVELVKRAVEAIEQMRQYTARTKEGFIFMNPVTGRPWHDERSQRDHYWKPALKATGTRYRRSYCCRHTYAANSLLAGVNPTYVAKQMGHANAKMLFTVYAKWIDGADRGREKAKMEIMLNQGAKHG